MRNFLFLLALSFIFCAELQADDTKHFFSIQEAMLSKAFEGRLNPRIRFYFEGNPNQKIRKNLGDFIANKKTNALVKSDREACEWAFLSALLSLQKRAISEGGNAVINIRSFYKKNEISDKTKFECRVGVLMAGVVLKGGVVSLD